MVKGKLKVCLPLLLSLIWLTGSSHISQFANIKEMLSNLAYDASENNENVVYLKENDEFVPYLVVSSDYNGGVLLLRSDLLSTTLPFNKNDSHMWASYEYGGYYEDSSIDTYLNSDFINTLSLVAKDSILDSNIVITAKSSLGIVGSDTTTISRKVFLLSLTELNGAKSTTSSQEGKPLKYFKGDYNRRVATLPNGDRCAYWTRTPEPWETYTVFTIGSNKTGAGSADIESGVRPAFCLPKTTKVVQSNNIVAGETVYVISCLKK